MIVVLDRVSHRLPASFQELEADARADGHANLTRLSSEFAENPAMFHHMLSAYVDSELAGIGAITDEPAPSLQPAWRMRRLYVHRSFRRHRVAGTIVAALLKAAARKVSLVTVHAGSDEAARFWEAVGFDRVADRIWSHQRTLDGDRLSLSKGRPSD
jgi:GNAT superfamily N-acetyltransferase